MSLSMHQVAVPVSVRALSNLRHVLRQGQAHAVARGYAPELLLQARLAPDMFPLLRQVQVASDMAARGCARLAGVEPRPFPDEETDFDALDARLAAVVAYIAGFTADQLEGSEAREVVFSTRNAGELRFSGRDYLLHYVLPNLFFHCSMAYAILRQAGAPIGKLDFLGRPQ